MKKFISMVLAAAMVTSLVPATAFAATGEVKATAKIVDALELTKEEAKTKDAINETNYPTEVPELQLKVTDVDYLRTDGKVPTMDVTLTLDNAEFEGKTQAELKSLVRFMLDDDRLDGAVTNEFVAAAVGNGATHFVDNLNNPKKIYTLADVATNDILNQNKVVAYLLDHDATFSVTDAPIQFKEGDTTTVVYDGNWKDGWTLDKLMKAVAEGKGTIPSGKARIEVAATADMQTAGFDATATLSTYADGNATDRNAITVERQQKLFAAENNLLAAKLQKVAGGTVDGTELEVIKVKDIDEDEATFVIEGYFAKDDIVIFDLESVLTKTSEGTKATVSVDSDMVTADDLVYVSVLGQGITASVKKLANVAEEERVKLEKDLKIKSNVGDFVNGQEFELKLSKGFEFYGVKNGADYTFGKIDDNKVTLTYTGVNPTDEITVKADDIEIEAVSAKAGTTATMTVKALKDGDKTFSATTTVEVAKVVDYKVELTVDEDEDVPVIYSGVNVDNYGITDDSDHLSLEVTAKETFPGAWSMRKGFNFELPEGVYVTDVTAISAENFEQNGDDKLDLDEAWAEAFFNAYQDGKHVNFEFDKRVFDDVDVDLATDPAELTFQLELVADPTFSGDVKLKLNGDLVDEQEVVIAKFVKPYEVKAEKNDLIIDYRNTKVPTAITITEAEAGLWAKDEAKFTFTIDRGDMINFEDDATFEVDKNSEMEIDDFTEEKEGMIGFTVEDESDEAATVTIKDMELFMNRSIPAGAYDLKITSSLAEEYEAQLLFAPDCVENWNDSLPSNHDADDDKKDNDCIVGDVCDYSEVAKEAFVNVITAGRDQDDASFTKKVVVPVGEKYIMAGEEKIDLDVPAYVSAAGYTMLPVRAVSTALGIKNDNVLWNQETRTVTILYGQRIITMSAGEKVVYVNGSAIPAAAKVEIKDDRTFLPMRDLATALGVTDITWDAATKTATLNGNQGK